MTTAAALEITRWYLAGFFLLVAGFYTVRLVVPRLRSGIRYVTHGRAGTLHWWLYLTFRVFRVTILAAMILRVPWPAFDSYLVPFSALTAAPLMIAGDILLATGFGFVLYCHAFMAEAWRSGIPQGQAPRLITDGPFRWSRNPIFLGVQVAQVGFFLAFPSLFTAVCLFVGLAVIQMQVRLEERHLTTAMGPAYRTYCHETTRWLRIRPAPAVATSSGPPA